MKTKKTIIFFVLLWAFNLSSQEIKNLKYPSSIELAFNYNHHLYDFEENQRPKFNYGLSLLYSEYIDNVKISLGIGYTKDGYENDLINDWPQEPIRPYATKRKHIMEYANFQILTHIFWGNKQYAGIFAGFSLNGMLKHKVHSNQSDGTTIKENTGNIDRGRDFLNVFLGPTFKKDLNNKLAINFTPYLSYRFYSGGEDGYSSHKYSTYHTDVPSYRFNLNFRLGIEYRFGEN